MTSSKHRTGRDVMRLAVRTSLALAMIGVPAMLTAPPVLLAAAQLEQLVARVKQAVVLVQVKKALGRRGRGSGFVYDASGLVLTNHHVVEGDGSRTDQGDVDKNIS